MIAAVRAAALDFRPRAIELPSAPGPWRVVWSAPVATPGGSRLMDTDGGPALVNAPSGIVAVGATPPGDERALTGRALFARPAVDGGPVLIDDEGQIYRWSPGGPARPVWETRAPGRQLDVIGLTDGRLLVQRPRGGVLHGLLAPFGADWVTEMVEPETGVRWRRLGELGGVLPSDDALFAVAADRRGVVCLDPTDGAERWTQPIAEGVSSLVARIERRLWLATNTEELLALDVVTGAREVRVRPPGIAVLDGVVDDRGRFHLCIGSRYLALDLTAAGATVVDVTLVGHEPSSLVFGSSALPTRDDRLVFVDRDGAIFAGSTAPSPTRTLLYRAPARLLACRAAHGMLLALGSDGTLTALAP